MGGTNPDEIERLIAAGIQVRQADDLHAKVYLFDKAVVIGSSNASANGLSFQDGDGAGWREANVLIEDPRIIEDVASWFEALSCLDVKAEDLIQARIVWNRRRLLAQSLAPEKSLLSMLKTRPAYFSDRAAWLVLSSTFRSDEAEALLERIRVEESPDIDAYEDLPRLPDEGQLLALWVGPRSAVTMDDYWERTPRLHDRSLSHGSLNLVLRRDDIAGLVWDHADRKEWRDIVARIRQSHFWDRETGCAVIHFKDVAKFVVAVPAPAPTEVLARRFDRAMRDQYQRIVTEARYPASELMHMLDQGKGLPVAQRLLAGGVNSGFTELWTRGFPHLSVEALILDAEWRSLFTAEELAEANRRLGHR